MAGTRVPMVVMDSRVVCVAVVAVVAAVATRVATDRAPAVKEEARMVARVTSRTTRL